MVNQFPFSTYNLGINLTLLAYGTRLEKIGMESRLSSQRGPRVLAESMIGYGLKDEAGDFIDANVLTVRVQRARSESKVRNVMWG